MARSILARTSFIAVKASLRWATGLRYWSKPLQAKMTEISGLSHLLLLVFLRSYRIDWGNFALMTG
jgi:hypothetical protein